MASVSTLTQASQGGVSGFEDLHIIDQMILERAPQLSQLKLWPLVKPALFRIFRYREAVTMADQVATMRGSEAFDYLCGELDTAIDVDGADNIPAEGGFILAPNHPTGLADGLAIYRLLRDMRPDMAIYANRDAIRISAGFRDVIIPVEWREDQKSFSKNRDTLAMTNRAFKDRKAVVIFPSGRIAYWNDGKLTERPWRNSAVVLARKYDIPVIPCGISSRNSGLFYLLSKYHTELRDMMLFHELMNKKGRPIRITIGKPVMPSEMEGDADAVTERLKRHTVETLAGM